jgi:hypothetical protein
MTAQFTEQLDIFTSRPTDSEVRVHLSDMSQGQFRAFHGSLRGPRCGKAKTLPADFVVDRCECKPNASQSTSCLVTEPCYWTFELPMLYDVTLQLELSDGNTATWRQAIGLRRWEIHGRDFFLEGKRVVLRGAVVDECVADLLPQAAEAEIALVVREPGDDFLERASELGVPLVVDLRGFAGPLTQRLLRYAWHPAVVLVLMDDEVEGGYHQPPSVRVGYVCDAARGLAQPDWADVIVFELAPGQRPPAWAATCAKPVIAIRRPGPYAELAEARRGCDRLQAELAPQFDLAGYFV